MFLLSEIFWRAIASGRSSPPRLVAGRTPEWLLLAGVVYIRHGHYSAAFLRKRQLRMILEIPAVNGRGRFGHVHTTKFNSQLLATVDYKFRAVFT